MSKGHNRTRWIGREIAAGSVRAVAFHVAITYLIPIGTPIITGYLGYLQNFPWMYIMVGAGLMFAAVTTGLVRFDEWRDRRRVGGKLRFVSVRAGRNIGGEGVFLGISLINKAYVPIEFEIKEIRTRIGDQVPTETDFVRRDFTIQPDGFAWFDDHIIKIKEPPHGSTLEGFLEYYLKYGKVGMMKNELDVKKQVIVAFNSDALLEPASWSDAA